MTESYGKTPSGLMVPVALEETGEVITSVSGLIGGALHTNPLMFGYSGIIRGQFVNVNLPAGSSNLDGTAIPTGQIYVITNLSVAYVGTITNVQLTVFIHNGVTDYFQFKQTPIVSGVFYDRQGWWVLAAGEFLRLGIVNATLNDDAYLSYSGFWIDINL